MATLAWAFARLHAPHAALHDALAGAAATRLEAADAAAGDDEGDAGGAESGFEPRRCAKP